MPVLLMRLQVFTHAIFTGQTTQEKEHYAQLTEVENEKRRREHILDVRDRAIADWEEEEAKRRGLMGQSVLEASTEHLRGLLLEVNFALFSCGVYCLVDVLMRVG